jgi:predicted dehydrogenase
MQNSPNDNIQIALIGAGGMGQGDTEMATKVPGVKLVAVADIYDGRRERCQEIWGSQVYTTRDFREILARKDVDAVIIATPDHWHAPITIAALGAGKDVYCEKPMVHAISEGPQVIEAMKKSGHVLQIGSQYASSAAFQKARELLAEGSIGELNLVEAWLDRNTAIGAWQYSLPPDDTPERIDWDRFLGNAPKRPFEPIRLFRWRNYNDYGTGLAGDLYVHLLTGLHVVTGSLGPTRIYSVGGTRFWKDGRDAPDVMLCTMDYPKSEHTPAFTFALRVNFASSEPKEQFGLRFTGSEGQMTVNTEEIKLTRTPRETEPGMTLGTFSKAVQKEIEKVYYAKYPPKPVTLDSLRPVAEKDFAFSGDPHQKHHNNFYKAVRSRKPFFEDGVFGFRTAGPALLANVSLYDQKVCGWDPVGLKVV